MAKLECRLYGDFQQILKDIELEIMQEDVSVNLKEESSFDIDNCMCAVRVYERFSCLGGSKLSLSVTLLQVSNEIFLSAIISGGSPAMFIQLEDMREKNFLNKLGDIIEKYRDPSLVKQQETNEEVNMQIRKGTKQDLEVIAGIEKICFSTKEAATQESFEKRLDVFADHFWLLELEGKVVGFIDGFVTNEKTISDKMYEQVFLHNELGHYQTIFGLNVLPDYRRRGYAALLLQALISDARKANRKGCILTCKERLIPYYEKFGFVNQGVSQSTHGDAVWYDMLLEFKDEAVD